MGRESLPAWPGRAARTHAGEAPMLYRVLDLRYCEKKQTIDDEPLQRLLHGHETVEITQQFYRHEGVPHRLDTRDGEDGPSVGQSPRLKAELRTGSQYLAHVAR
ncbi:MAG: hypothetical protein HYZ53_29540 [Planctomycetes bacterium]|nr:hypothetical protein [Planctomycetota bacterium]